MVSKYIMFLLCGVRHVVHFLRHFDDAFGGVNGSGEGGGQSVAVDVVDLVQAGDRVQHILDVGALKRKK